MSSDAFPYVKLLNLLQGRFEQHPTRHAGIKWLDVAARLMSRPHKLSVLQAMEDTGGEPDVIGIDRSTGEYLFVDCSAESPKGRRSLCYDEEALDERKTNKPAGSAAGMATEMGIELLSEAEYRMLQALGEFDIKTSSWILTLSPVRKLGGALFCDRRYGQVFVYHNSAESYYAARGFRGLLRV